MGKTIDIGGRLHSTEQGNVVAGANEIYDDTKGKKQDVINGEVDAALEGLDQSKQDNLTFDQTPTEDSTNPVTSGGVYAADLALQQAIEAILTLIPSAASALNQLADKSFVNSSLATASATFRGTYNLVSDLHLSVTASHQDIATALASAVSTADNNDYCFVQIPTSDTSSDIRVTERYKFNGTAWAYEYDLNNSGFTAAQWAAINSGITLALVTKLGALPTASELATALAGKQNTLTFDSEPVSGSQNPVYSGGLYTLFAAIDAKMPSAASASNKLVAEDRLAAYVTAIIGALDATYNVTSTDGHVTVKVTQADGAITDLQVLTSDIASATALTALGTRVSQNEVDIAALQALYNSLQQSAPQIIQPTDTWPVANPSDTVIYRVIDRVNTPPEYYSDYMWNGTAMVLMATYNNAIDDEPTAGSDNLVKSGGVAKSIIGDYKKLYCYNINLLYDGETNVAQGIYSTDYLSIENIDRFFFTGVNGAYAVCLCFYDENKNFLGYYGNLSTSYTKQEVKSSDYPNGAKYVRLSNAGNVYGIWGLLGTADLFEVLSEKIDEKPSMSDIAEQMMGDSTKLYSENVRLMADGDEDAYPGFYTTPFISLQDVDHFWFSGKNASAVICLAFYNASKQFLGYYGSLSTTYVKQEVKASDYPNGAKYVRLSNVGQESGYGVWGIPGISDLYGYIKDVASAKPDYFEVDEKVIGDSMKLYIENMNLHSDGTEEPYPNFYSTDYLSLEGTEKFYFSGKNGAYAVCLCFYDENKQFLSYYGSLSTTYEKQEVMASDYPVGAKYIKLSNAGSSSGYGVWGLLGTADLYGNIVKRNIPDISAVANFNKVFGVSPNSAYNRSYAVKLYIEGFIKNKADVTFNNKLREFILYTKGTLPSTGNILSVDNDIDILNVEGRSILSHSVQYISSSITRGKNKLINLLAIGDSTLDKDLSDAKGQKVGGWNYISCVKEFIAKDNKDVGNISATMIGTRNNQSNRSIDYGGETIPIRAFSEGFSGWSSYNFLNFPCDAKIGQAYESIPRLSSSSMWYALGLATKTPYNSSTPGQSWVEYVDSDEQRMLLVTTPFGRYKCDYGSNSDQYENAEQLWIDVNKMNGVISPVTYTGSAEQKAYMDNFFNAKMSEPDNPFYSQEKARAYTGDYVWTYDNAFSLDVYLSRYRTMDDLGVRLTGSAGDSVTGSDGETYVIGTKVVNTSDWDVCRPNYVFIGTGINDTSAGLPIAKTSILNLINTVCAEDANIKTAWGIPRGPFVFENCYKNVNAIVGENNDTFDVNNEMFTLLNDSSQSSRKMFLPIFNTTSVIGNTGCVAPNNIDSDDCIISSGSDGVHPSIYQSRTIAYQIYSWLYYIN